MLEQVLKARYQGLYVPNLPPKKKMGNKDQEFVDQRCFFLNQFFKQLVRCPYLYESEELQQFLRPTQDNLIKALTFMPKPSFTKQLDVITKYYLLPDQSREEVSKKLNNADFF